ncbi:MAG: hypothetical protein LBI55_03725 [Oscillospiraceae bacterium]|jgi:hypothetical protein|nr:hypothetical protein [Oscillospiraceae bacterium]
MRIIGLKSRKKGRKLIFTLMFLLLFSFLILGLIVVDRNTRLIGFGDESSFLEIADIKPSEHGLTLTLLGDDYFADCLPIYEFSEKIAEEVVILSDNVVLFVLNFINNISNLTFV